MRIGFTAPDQKGANQISMAANLLGQKCGACHGKVAFPSERYVHESQVMRDTAKQQAAHGDHQSALNSLLEAIKHIQTALKSVGLVLPD
ncbi:MAG: hypothetical protein ABI536_02265 [Gallionella sp.]